MSLFLPACINSQFFDNTLQGYLNFCASVAEKDEMNIYNTYLKLSKLRFLTEKSFKAFPIEITISEQ